MKQLWISSGKDQMSIRSLKESDFVITTGRKLQQTFRSFNTNVSIFRNMFDWEQPQWKQERKFPAKDGKITIGWIGLTSHFEDIKKMAPIMKYIHDKYSNTYFYIAGMAIKDTEVTITIDKDGNKKFDEVEIKDETKTYKARVKQLFKDFDQSRIEFHDAVSLETYAKFYREIDISLCYIEHLTFNQCKSEIKAVESVFYENILVCMNYGGYNDMYNMMPESIRHRNNFVNTEVSEHWKEALEYWVNNYEEGRKYAKLQSEWVKDVYDINKHIDERVKFYNDTLESWEEKEMNRIKNILV